MANDGREREAFSRMSNLQARLYDYPVDVTKSDSVNDPAGPFSGLLVQSAGNVRLTPCNGPAASSSITLAVVAGQYLDFPVLRVWSTNTSATVCGLVSAVKQPGMGS